MSYWGAQVIISLFDAIPWIGPALSEWFRGDFVVSDATLNRFFAFHVIAIPLVLVILVFLHIVALHKVGSNNPDGVEIKKLKGPDGIPLDGIPFHPYYTVKDIVGMTVFLMVFAAIMFFAPELGGWFLERDNFVPANILQTPSEIVPLWYFTPFYSIRANTVSFILDARSGRDLYSALNHGVLLPPWLDRSPVKSSAAAGSTRPRWQFSWSRVCDPGYLGTKSPQAINLILFQCVLGADIHDCVLRLLCADAVVRKAR